jgi:GNAT superfamily N-acetyltransferase
MLPDIALRAAIASDVPVILHLIRGLAEYERLLHRATATEAELHDALFRDPPRAHVLLADVGGASVGLALFYYTFSTFTARTNIFLEDLFVESVHRGCGVGFALMRGLAQRAVAENCGRIEWRVLNWNRPSIDFYQRLGANRVDAWQTRQLSGDALVSLAKGALHG